ncbi:MAG: XRE family transcriptional regulator [Candidatus Rokubacteria bacterium]|nr:XRE family transcriptional regulator [Candidatus Rokubacteria bacterium]
MPVTLDPAVVEREAAVTDIAKIAAFLQDALGQKVTAYLGGLRDAKVVGRWVRGQVDPRDTVKMRLRSGYQAARMIVAAYGTETAKAWFFGSNTRLDDEAPASILRRARTPDDLRGVVPAARAFAGAAD